MELELNANQNYFIGKAVKKLTKNLFPKNTKVGKFLGSDRTAGTGIYGSIFERGQKKKIAPVTVVPEVVAKKAVVSGVAEPSNESKGIFGGKGLFGNKQKRLAKKAAKSLSKGAPPMVVSEGSSGGFAKEIIKKVIGKEIDTKGNVPFTPEQEEAKIGFNELKVFKPAMSLSVRTKGLNPSSNTETLAYQFYDNVVRNTLESQNFADGYQTPKDIVIDAIVKYFISAKKKKDSGADIGKIDQIAAAGYEQAQSSINEAVDKEVKMTAGNWMVENKGILIGGAVAFFVLIIVLIARK